MAQKSINQVEQLVRELFVRKDGPRELLQHLVQRYLELEAAQHLGADRHQRSSTRQGHRNG